MKVSFFKSYINFSGFSLDSELDYTLSLEQKLSKKYGKNILSVNNIASAFRLSLSAINTKRGDKMICAINAYPEIPQAIRSFDSEPIFSDIEDKTYNIDINSLQSTLAQCNGKKLKAVIVTHFAGNMVDIEPILEFAKEYKLTVIEDFCDVALDREISIKSDIAILSLNNRLDNRLKGAFIYFKDEKVFQRAKVLRENGIVFNNKNLPYIYDIVDIGYDYRIDDLNASLFLEKSYFTSNWAIELREAYNKLLQNTKNVTISKMDDLAIYYIIEISRNRDIFVKKLIDMGIEVRLFNIPLNFTTYYKSKYGFKVISFPKALGVYQKVIALPFNASMSKKDVEFVANSIKEVASSHIWVDFLREYFLILNGMITSLYF